MQKIRAIFTYSVMIFLIGNIFFPIGASFAGVYEYDYSQYIDKINTSFSPNIVEKNLRFESPRTTFFLRFPDLLNFSEDIEVEWIVDGKIFTRHLDHDMISTDDSIFTTFPFVTTARNSIWVRIKNAIHIGSIEIITSNQNSVDKRITFIPWAQNVSADSGLSKVVSRKEWWADESLRYISLDTRKKRIDDWILRWKTPRIIEETSLENKTRIESDRQYNSLAILNPDVNSTQSIVRYEDKNKLTWPIERTKKVDRIIIHHTAENLMQDADDKTLLRAIYLYHTKSRWWGDIGYNYIIGQRGDIYEWRAGGDYVKGAHVYANNSGTVGISLIGNYDALHLNRDQKEWMIEAISYVAKKYGINLKEEGSGIIPCGSKDSCIWKKNVTLRLSGHRDSGATDCPGDNLYELIPELINTVVWKVWYIQPVLNTAPIQLDPLDPEDISTIVIEDTTRVIDPEVKKLRVTPSFGGKNTKIKLSYPHDTITLKSWASKKSIVRIDGRIVPFGLTSLATVSQNWSNGILLKIQGREYSWSQMTIMSDVVLIPSWQRIPEWDTNKKYNDNLFRGKILIRSENGKILVINELPIEDYLRWLGEVSDSDLSEKVKTIVVAARSYIYYYSDPLNRKYGTLLYDGSDNPDEFQRYLGYGYEMRSPRVSEAVKSTRGEGILYKKKLVKPWYFSSSNGQTLSYKQYCERVNPGKSNCEDIAYLQSVPDPVWLGKNQSGHGVGISGIGATYGAAQGKKYKEIIQYYLKWVEIGQIKK